MFARSVNIHNVVGRIKYCRDKKNREEVVGFVNTSSDEFWALLAKENQMRFQETPNALRDGRRASEAREFIVGLPADMGDQFAAQMLAAYVKIYLGVECVVSVHKKYSNKNGERKLNVHAHVIVAERTLLPEPVIIEEKRAERTYYYDANGKKCKKADAVKVTKKGDVIQKGAVHYFSNKEDFYSVHKENPLEKIQPFIDALAQGLHWEKFDGKKHFAYRHVGQNNPKGKHIEAYNRLVGDMNAFFDRLDVEGSEPMKRLFCRSTGISERFGVNRTDEVREAFERFRRELEANLRMQYATLEQARGMLEDDIEQAEVALSVGEQDDFVRQRVAMAYRNALEEKYRERLDRPLLARLKEKLNRVLDAIDVVREKLRRIGAGHKAGGEREQAHVPGKNSRNEREYE